MVLITVRLPGGASLDAAMEKLGLSERDVDTSYGLVAIDPDHSLYGLRVTDEAAHRAHDAEGPFSDPRIEPFGPPQ
jgi:hypothetical protein